MPYPISKQKSSIFRRKMFWIVTALVLLLIAGIAIPRVVSYQHDKAVAAEKIRFAQAEKDIEEIAANIIAANGQPFKVYESKSCSRPSRDAFQPEAELSCGVYRQLFYEVASANRAIEITENVKTIARDTWEYTNSNSSRSVSPRNKFSNFEIPYSARSSHQLIVDNYSSFRSDMNCSIANTYYKSDQPPYAEYAQGGNSIALLAIGLDCKKDVITQQYPVRE